jgi:peptide-methionine (R)-S-oxide reductase
MTEGMQKIEKTEAEWRAELPPAEFAVLREAATEQPGTGPLLHEHRTGIFRCRACGNPLFRSDTKFESGSGWPSFWEPISKDAIDLETDRSLFMTRTEVKCGRCGSHLGHVFEDAPQTPTGDRFCMNSLALDFNPEAETAGDPTA